MAGVLFALTMTAGCGSQNQDHAATAESQTQDTASGSGTAAQSENTDQKQTDGDRTDTAEADVTEEALQDNENTEKSSKVLVAYYSATGNTKAAAETIADAAGGELPYGRRTAHPQGNTGVRGGDRNRRGTGTGQNHLGESGREHTSL